MLKKPNKTKAYNRIIKVIDSCVTMEHFTFTENMIDSFNKLFGMTISLDLLLSKKLRDVVDTKLKDSREKYATD